MGYERTRSRTHVRFPFPHWLNVACLLYIRSVITLSSIASAIHVHMSLGHRAIITNLSPASYLSCRHLSGALFSLRCAPYRERGDDSAGVVHPIAYAAVSEAAENLTTIQRISQYRSRYTSESCIQTCSIRDASLVPMVRSSCLRFVFLLMSLLVIVM